ncbi:MAG: thymidine phosphorylase, partial [Candidatus Gastranaerophilales bacterium]|nr:thymidine phosphorylase [Candidatus Gastranaerophilales bacterium]
MKIIDIIEKKKNGKALNEEEIKFFINGIMDNSIEDYQTSALLMAIYFKGMNLDETTWLTKYMVESGEIMDLSDISDNIADKHSTGGVGDKITLIFLPLMAAAGIYTAKLSGRGLGHTGGTIDKLESIPNFRTDLSIEEFKTKVKEHKTAIAAQTLSLAPADGKLYALRDVTSTVDIIPLIASSVVSKKIASGANHIILDVKYGSGAFIKTAEEAQRLSEVMVEVGKRLNKNICAVISSMNQPLGRAVGNSVEIQEVIEFLKGNMEPDLKEITYTLVQTAFEKAGKVMSKEEGYKYLDELILSGKALDKFKEIISSQNGDTSVIDDYTKLPQAAIKYEVKSTQTGYVKNIDALKIAKACKNLGAGREKKTDLIDYSAGIYLTQKCSEPAAEGETIAVIYTNKKEAIKEAENLILSAYEFSDTKEEYK